MMFSTMSINIARGTAAGIVEQGGGTDDLQVSAFGPRQALGDSIHSQYMVKIVYRVSISVPLFSFVQCNDGHGGYSRLPGYHQPRLRK